MRSKTVDARTALKDEVRTTRVLHYSLYIQHTTVASTALTKKQNPRKTIIHKNLAKPALTGNIPSPPPWRKTQTTRTFPPPLHLAYLFIEASTPSHSSSNKNTQHPDKKSKPK